jgi:cyanophycin synthetase
MMKKKELVFRRVTHLRGPNIWTYRPVIEAWVDIGELEQFPSNKIPGLYERLTAWLPTLVEHRCGVGERGGFLERLREGTWAAHILEHVVLELQSLAGMPTGFGKARETSESGVYKVAFRTRQEEVGRAALEAARDLLMAAIEDRPYDVAAAIGGLREMVDSICLGPSTAHIVDAATERRIPSIRLNDGNLVQFGYGARQRRIWTAETDRTSAIAEGISRDKDLTKSLLQSCGVPVPQGRLVDDPADAWDAAEDIGLPVAVKPYDGNHGRGVSLDLTSREAGGSRVRAGQPRRQRRDRRAVDFRRRAPPAGGGQARGCRRQRRIAVVTGDGKSTIAELIDSPGQHRPAPWRGRRIPAGAAEAPRRRRAVAAACPPGPFAHHRAGRGREGGVQRNGNVAFDVTDKVHPDTAALASLAARVVGLDIAGIDLVVEDVSKPLGTARRHHRSQCRSGPAGPHQARHRPAAAGGHGHRRASVRRQ